eukprot:s1434_g13.t1
MPTVALLECNVDDERFQGKAFQGLLDAESLTDPPSWASGGQGYVTYEVTDGRSPCHNLLAKDGQCPERPGHGEKRPLGHRHAGRVTSSFVPSEGVQEQLVVLRSLPSWVEAFKPSRTEPMLPSGAPVGQGNDGGIGLDVPMGAAQIFCVNFLDPPAQLTSLGLQSIGGGVQSLRDTMNEVKWLPTMRGNGGGAKVRGRFPVYAVFAAPPGHGSRASWSPDAMMKVLKDGAGGGCLSPSWLQQDPRKDAAWGCRFRSQFKGRPAYELSSEVNSEAKGVRRQGDVKTHQLPPPGPVIGSGGGTADLLLEAGGKPDAGASVEEQGSLAISWWEDEAEHSTGVLRATLNYPEIVSPCMSLWGVLLILSRSYSLTRLWAVPSPFLEPGSDDGTRGARQRSLLPSPLQRDSQVVLLDLHIREDIQPTLKGHMSDVYAAFRAHVAQAWPLLMLRAPEAGPNMDQSLTMEESLVSPSSMEGILLSGLSQSPRWTDFGVRLDEAFTASDASEGAGGMVYGAKFTPHDLKELHALDEGLDDPISGPVSLGEEQVILALSGFGSSNGLLRTLQLAKVPVDRLVVNEQAVEFRWLNAARWPGCNLLVDTKRVTMKGLEKTIRSVPNLTGVRAAGGSPCQELSQLSAFRKHLEDPQFKLFHNFCERFRAADEMCTGLEVWVIARVENVIGDETDIEEMFKELGAHPLIACAISLLRVRRPRLYWTHVILEDHPTCIWAQHAHYAEVSFEEEMGPLEKDPDERWSCPAAEENEEQKVPRFTRVTPHKRPPSFPVGLSQCVEEMGVVAKSCPQSCRSQALLPLWVRAGA